MSTENTPVQVTELKVQVSETRPEVIEKMGRWAEMGRFIHDYIPSLQAGMQAITAPLILNPTVEQIPQAEAILTETKRKYATHKEERVKNTNKFVAIIDKCIEPEKTGLTVIEQATAGLLKAKQELATQQATVKAKDDELKRIREAIINHIAKKDAEYLVRIEKAVTVAFEAGLNGACPDEASVPTYLSGLKDGGIMNGDVPESFMWMRPPIKPNYATDEEVSEIWAELSDRIQPPTHYQAIWADKLDEKFGFYGLALKNKEDALRAAKNAELESMAAIQNDKLATEQAAKLEAVASTYTNPSLGVPVTKSLKYDWLIQMDDTPQIAMIIMAAFVANSERCKGGVRVKSWRKLSVEQMASALEWAKKQDENFNVANLNFVKIDKL